MGGLPLLHVRHGEHLSLTRQAYVSAGYRTRNLLIVRNLLIAEEIAIHYTTATGT